MLKNHIPSHRSRGLLTMDDETFFERKGFRGATKIRRITQPRFTIRKIIADL